MNESQFTMYVVKRDGKRQPVQFDKVSQRLAQLCIKHCIKVNYYLIAKKTMEGLHDGVKTSELDNLAAETAAYMSVNNSDYGKLATAIYVSNMHKSSLDFKAASKLLFEAGAIRPDYWKLVELYGTYLSTIIDPSKDYDYDYSGVKTINSVSLMYIGETRVETPQYCHMRIALELYQHDTKAVISCYRFLADKMCIHGTPVSINAGMSNRLSSCFLLPVNTTTDATGTMINSVYETIAKCAAISSSSGGVGFSCTNVPAIGTRMLPPASGIHQGIIPMLRNFNETGKYSSEGKRKSAFACYLEPWHAEVLSFIELRKTTGKEERRCRDLFLALWIPDLFMERVEARGSWSLFCPLEAPGLHNCWGNDFKQLYEKYEQEGRARQSIPALTIWNAIIANQIEGGTPYMLFKDACNLKSNQSHLGCIRSSNLCTEIIQYSSNEETAVCNLASISLPMCIVDGAFNHNKLFEITAQLTRNLNKVIDRCDYPVASAKLSNEKHRSIGIGVQGLADTFMKLQYPFVSSAARQLNIEIFETIYYAYARTSCDLAKEQGKTYASFAGSYTSKGILNYKLYNHTPTNRWPFTQLEQDVIKYGMVNSLGVCCMPTATGSIILGNNEGIEPYISNVFVRKLTAGEFIVTNEHLVADLKKLGIWDTEIRRRIIVNNGSVQNIEQIPATVRELYKTAWEIKMRDLIDMAVDRLPFIDQSQSFSIFMEKPSRSKLSGMLMYGWKRGLKTGMYYLRSRPSLNASLAAACDSCSV